MDALETIEKDDYTIKIYADDEPESPRTWDNLGQMVCYHRRLNLGDEHNYSVDELHQMLNSGEYFYLPIYAYEHGGITISTGNDRYPFNDMWDSGQLGYIIVSKKNVRHEWHVKRISPRIKKLVYDNLRAEIETYDNYLTGAVYGYRVVYNPVGPVEDDDEDTYYNDDEDDDNDEGELIDSCWGFYGYDHQKSGLLGQAEAAIKYHHEHTYKQLVLSDAILA